MAKGNPIDHGLANWDAEKYPPVEHEETAPLKLTVNKPVKIYGASVGLLSSQEWSGQFYRYLTPAFHYAADKARGRVNWWHVPSIITRLQRDSSVKLNQSQALLAVRVQGVAWPVAFDRYHCTAAQLGRLEERIRRQYQPARAA